MTRKHFAFCAKSYNKGVQDTDADGFTGQGPLFLHVASKDLHGSDPQAQGEEGLVHGCGDDVGKAHLGGPFKIREQVEGQAFLCSGQQDAVDSQDKDQDEQTAHHPFGDPLQAVSKSQAADQKACDDCDGHPEPHFHGISQKRAEHAGNGFGVQSLEGSGQEFKKVADHPAGDSGVIHH